MALERQITFSTNVSKTIDTEVESYLRENEVDPALIQIVIDGGNGVKTATLTYANRNSLKTAYEAQNRKYTDADAVTYCHVKDIITAFSNNLDDEVNEFLADENISVLSITRYFTLANKGAFIFYLDLTEQKEKLKIKEEEIAKAREELANKLAQEAVKEPEPDLAQPEIVEKLSQVDLEEPAVLQTADEIENDISAEVVAEETKLEATVPEKVETKENKNAKRNFFANKK